MTTVWREFSGSLRRHGDVRWPARCTQVGPGQLPLAPFSVGVTGLGGSCCGRRPPQQSRSGGSRCSSRGHASQRGSGRSRRCPAALTVALSQSGQSCPASRSQSHDLHRCQLLRPRRPQTRQGRHLRVCQSLPAILRSRELFRRSATADPVKEMQTRPLQNRNDKRTDRVASMEGYTNVNIKHTWNLTDRERERHAPGIGPTC